MMRALLDWDWSARDPWTLPSLPPSAIRPSSHAAQAPNYSFEGSKIVPIVLPITQALGRK